MKAFFRQFFCFLIPFLIQINPLQGMEKALDFKLEKSLFREELRLQEAALPRIRAIHDEMDELLGECLICCKFKAWKDPVFHVSQTSDQVPSCSSSRKKEIDERLAQLSLELYQIRQNIEQTLMALLTPTQQAEVLEYGGKRDIFFIRKKYADQLGGIPFYELDSKAFIPYAQPRDRSDVYAYFVDRRLRTGASYDKLFIEMLREEEMAASLKQQCVTTQALLGNKRTQIGYTRLSQECVIAQALLKRKSVCKQFILSKSRRMVVDSVIKASPLSKITEKPKLYSDASTTTHIQNPISKYFAYLVKKIRVCKSVQVLKKHIAALEALAKSNFWQAKEFLGVFYSTEHNYTDGVIPQNKERAIKFLSSCAQEWPDLIKPQSLFILGKLLSEDHENLETALKFIKLSLECRYEVKKEECAFLAELYFKAKQFDESIKWIEKIKNTKLIIWHKGRCALTCGDILHAAEFFERIFPLCKSMRYLPKEELLDFDAVVQALIQQMDIPRVNALLVRMELAVGLQHPKFTRDFLVQKLLRVASVDKDISVNFIRAHLYFYGIGVEKSLREVMQSLGFIFLLESEEEWIELLNKPEQLELFQAVTDPIIEDFTYDFLNEKSKKMHALHQTPFFLIAACYMLSSFFAFHDEQEKAAMFFVAAESCLVCICKQDPENVMIQWPGVQSAFNRISSLAEKNSIYAIAALSFSDSLRLPNKVKVLNDVDTTVRRFLKMIPKFLNLSKTNKNKFNKILAIACNLAGSYFYDVKHEISNALKSLRLALKFFPEARLIIYNLGSVIISDDPDHAKEGRDLLLSICSDSPGATYMLGCFYDPKNTTMEGDFVKRSKDVKIAVDYYEQAAKLGCQPAYAALAVHLISKKDFNPEDKEKLEGYIKLAGDAFSCEERRALQLFMERKNREKCTQVASEEMRLKARSALALLEQVDVFLSGANLVGACKLHMNFLDILENDIVVGNVEDAVCGKRAAKAFFDSLVVMRYRADLAHNSDFNVARTCRLFIDRIDQRLLSEAFFQKIQSIQSFDELYAKHLIEHLCFICRIRSNTAYLGKLMSYYIDSFGCIANSFYCFLDFLKQQVGSDENLKAMVAKIEQQMLSLEEKPKS